ncbi:MAG: NAD-dependent malic enzyme, partial [Gammaproteobacteria bacterium]|nr:NAD-dependent malic enzyme [Gammaproteobacteria bacterium]
VIPAAFDKRIAPAVAQAVAKAAMDSGVARTKVDLAEIAQRLSHLNAE